MMSLHQVLRIPEGMIMYMRRVEGGVLCSLSSFLRDSDHHIDQVAEWPLEGAAVPDMTWCVCVPP